MKVINFCFVVGSTALTLAVLSPSGTTAAPSGGDGGLNSRNESGVARTVSSAGFIDQSGAFFQDLGTNGRRCVTCHQPGEGWAISAKGVRQRFDDTDGRDPIFRLVDGSNSPTADVSTVAKRRRAYSMLLSKGLIRVERPVPPAAEVELVAAGAPYNYASAAGLSLFRRPLPSTNLGFISTVMWDGREVDPTTPMRIANSPATNRAILVSSLLHQSVDATTGHAQGVAGLTPAQQQDIVDFELGLATAQIRDDEAGSLTSSGALGGPENILGFPFYIGINDNVADPHGPFNPAAMSLYDVWSGSHEDQRKSIARGQDLFNNKPIVISGVRGLNDNPYFGSPTSFTGSCTTCHNSPNMGNHSLAVALNIGLTDGSRRTPDMPLYTLRNKVTGEIQTSTDPGLALSTGKWNDVGRFKGPILRGLATRAPYFHNGFAKDLSAVLDFYQERFAVTFTARERRDLIAFLRSL
jgi:cytochrome c peroxidase